MEDMSGLRWFKSSFSGGTSDGGGGCVEAAALGPHRAVRDSTDPGGPAFVFSNGSWNTFVRAVKSGQFDLTKR